MRTRVPMVTEHMFGVKAMFEPQRSARTAVVAREAFASAAIRTASVRGPNGRASRSVVHAVRLEPPR